MNTPSPPLFEIRDVTYAYPEVTALDRATLRIEKGERIALLGANGSGKSTLLRMLAGLAFPTQGTVDFCGTQLTESAFQNEAFAFDFRRRVAFIFQNPDAQLFNPTVFDEVAFGPLQMRWPKARILEQVDAVLASLEIAHLKNRAPHRLSGGEKKRVALASVLVLDPDVLLLDEPTAALDPQSQSRIIDFLIDCRGKKTVVTATHELHILEEIADRCIILQNGRVDCEGTPHRILGDDALLRRTHLIHAHRHRHATGVIHSHPHLHGASEHTHNR